MQFLIFIVLFFFMPTSWAQSETAGAPLRLQFLPLYRTGQISTYSAAGESIDFQGTAQDGEFQRGEVWPEPRFNITDHGTVIDKLTGLMWMKDGDCFGKLPWQAALQKVEELNAAHVLCHDYTGNFADWMLPDINQLASLVNAEDADAGDYLRLHGLRGFHSDLYWSSTPYQNPLNVWSVNFENGAVLFQNRLTPLYLLPVRVMTSAETGSDLNEKKRKKEGQGSSQGQANDSRETSGNRYLDNYDGTITDTFSGLMWLQDASCFEGLNWQASIDTVKKFNEAPQDFQCLKYKATYTDWSLPNKLELRSLVDYNADFPALDAKNLLSNVEGRYWTGTTSAAVKQKAFSVDFNTGVLDSAPKSEKLAVLPVRQAVVQLSRPRLKSQRAANIDVEKQFVMTLAPELQEEIHWPPSPRFISTGDGTSMDIITGTHWLTDARCFEKQNWEDSFKVLLPQFNSDPGAFKCLEYEANFNDWEMPSMEELLELINKNEKDSAAWLNTQGVKNVQSSGDYWTSAETKLNLYYAQVVNMKHGGVRNYPKTLKFNVWPRRKLLAGDRQPFLNITVNTIGGFLNLSQEDPLSITLYLHTFGLRDAADFWLWYVTPEGVELWLSPTRVWKDTMTPVYQGDLFNLNNYEIYKSLSNKLAPGEYTIHFAVDLNQNGVLDASRYENLLLMNVVEGETVQISQSKKEGEAQLVP